MIRKMNDCGRDVAVYVTLGRCICSLDFFNEEERAPMAEKAEATVVFEFSTRLPNTSPVLL